jgi:ferritin-like metal-binding protein YciE
MTSNPEQNLMSWLRDAYAMERQQSIESTEKQVRRMEGYPELRAWVEDHLAASERQAERLKECIHRHGGDVSSLKGIAAKLMGNVQAITGMLAADEVVKTAIADYAYKHYEIACYRSLAIAAEMAGDAETRRICEESLREEQRLADRVAELVPQLTSQYVGREAHGQQAAH